MFPFGMMAFMPSNLFSTTVAQPGDLIQPRA
jgi:hypothetical protein